MQHHAREAHRGELKPHQCQQCLKSFSSNHQLTQHIRIHTGEKPYKCSYCDRRFKQLSHVQQHTRLHTGNDVPEIWAKPYKCAYCARRFKQLSHVQQHTRLHTGERPYKCHLPQCGRAFIQLSNLQQHLRNHDSQMERSKNRPFACTICGKGFASDKSLTTHRAKQHAALIGGASSQSCPICHKICINGEMLMEHMRLAHKDPNASGTPSATRSNTIVTKTKKRVGGGGQWWRDRSQPIGERHSKKKQTVTEMKTEELRTHDARNSILNCLSLIKVLGVLRCRCVADKRRLASHLCPVCGKTYVNEGSLRKHVSSHPEAAAAASMAAASPLRMWPCTVCQSMFTQEAGLLHHMETMRMDPKHQFAAQYVLSRAAAERREKQGGGLTLSLVPPHHPHHGGPHHGHGVRNGAMDPIPLHSLSLLSQHARPPPDM
ncbi:hypothetical protein LAZ67_21000538 [Cordylochernes scorpioides]|uniref:C2H2-type domain-containing protein n=1 Tax=Cordylochernes scorpioides TaxID=51811 RepID=A0ABY6LPE3_9ARAC|nr:hypothetical protein LAZ67_21000538 [Cordylochernes scorpioides]